MMELGYLNDCMKADARLRKGVLWFTWLMVVLCLALWSVLDFVSEVIF